MTFVISRPTPPPETPSLEHYKFVPYALEGLGIDPDVIEAAHELAREVRYRDELPEAHNGFRFVVDQRPHGRLFGLIPPLEYTGYFQRREIPLSELHHMEFSHDTNHIKDFLTLTRVTPMANLLQAAACGAGDDLERCRTFTGAIDKLADTVDDVVQGRKTWYVGLWQIEEISKRIKVLMELRRAGAEADVEAEQRELNEIIAGLWLDPESLKKAEAYARAGWAGNLALLQTTNS